MIDTQKLRAEYDAKHAWGMVASIDAHGCEPGHIRSHGKIQALIDGLVETARMMKHGPSYIERFGHEGRHPGPGFSAMQFIETSSVTVHCDEFENRAFIDLFSCAYFDPNAVCEFVKNFLHASDCAVVVTIRS